MVKKKISPQKIIRNNKLMNIFWVLCIISIILYSTHDKIIPKGSFSTTIVKVPKIYNKLTIKVSNNFNQSASGIYTRVGTNIFNGPNYKLENNPVFFNKKPIRWKLIKKKPNTQYPPSIIPPPLENTKEIQWGASYILVGANEQSYCSCPGKKWTIRSGQSTLCNDTIGDRWIKSDNALDCCNKCVGADKSGTNVGYCFGPSKFRKWTESYTPLVNCIFVDYKNYIILFGKKINADIWNISLFKTTWKPPPGKITSNVDFSPWFPIKNKYPQIFKDTPIFSVNCNDDIYVLFDTYVLKVMISSLFEITTTKITFDNAITQRGSFVDIVTNNKNVYLIQSNPLEPTNQTSQITIYYFNPNDTQNSSSPSLINLFSSEILEKQLYSGISAIINDVL